MRLASATLRGGPRPANSAACSTAISEASLLRQLRSWSCLDRKVDTVMDVSVPRAIESMATTMPFVTGVRVTWVSSSSLRSSPITS